MNATSEYAATTDSPADTPIAAHASTNLPLRRPASGRVLGGVAAAVARSIGEDPMLVRLGFIVLTLIGGAGLPLYLAGWLLIPDENSGRSLAAELVQFVSRHRS